LANDTDLDPEGQPGLLTVTGVGVDGEEGVTEAGGTVEVTNVGESIRYNAPAKFEGTDRFLYSAQDAQGKGCSAEVTVTVAGVVVSPEPNNPGPPENPENPGNPGNSSGPDQPGSPSGPSSPEQPESGPESIVDPPTSTPPGAGNRNTPGGAPGPAAAAVATPTPGSAAVVVPAAAVLRSTGSSVSSPSGTLPRTGSGVGGLTAMAMAAVVAGLALVMVSRRRNRRTR
jgi:LPXTG-motif cell wall-anchored protein